MSHAEPTPPGTTRKNLTPSPTRSTFAKIATEQIKKILPGKGKSTTTRRKKTSRHNQPKQTPHPKTFGKPPLTEVRPKTPDSFSSFHKFYTSKPRRLSVDSTSSPSAQHSRTETMRSNAVTSPTRRTLDFANVPQPPQIKIDENVTEKHNNTAKPKTPKTPERTLPPTSNHDSSDDQSYQSVKSTNASRHYRDSDNYDHTIQPVMGTYFPNYAAYNWHNTNPFMQFPMPPNYIPMQPRNPPAMPYKPHEPYFKVQPSKKEEHSPRKNPPANRKKQHHYTYAKEIVQHDPDTNLQVDNRNISSIPTNTSRMPPRDPHPNRDSDNGRDNHPNKRPGDDDRNGRRPDNRRPDDNHSDDDNAHDSDDFDNEPPMERESRNRYNSPSPPRSPNPPYADRIRTIQRLPAPKIPKIKPRFDPERSYTWCIAMERIFSLEHITSDDDKCKYAIALMDMTHLEQLENYILDCTTWSELKENIQNIFPEKSEDERLHTVLHSVQMTDGPYKLLETIAKLLKSPIDQIQPAARIFVKKIFIDKLPEHCQLAVDMLGHGATLKQMARIAEDIYRSHEVRNNAKKQDTPEQSQTPKGREDHIPTIQDRMLEMQVQTVEALKELNKKQERRNGSYRNKNQQFNAQQDGNRQNQGNQPRNNSSQPAPSYPNNTGPYRTPAHAIPQMPPNQINSFHPPYPPPPMPAIQGHAQNQQPTILYSADVTTNQPRRIPRYPDKKLFDNDNFCINHSYFGHRTNMCKLRAQNGKECQFNATHPNPN